MIRAITVILTAILIASCDTGITEPEPETVNVDGITAPITEGVTPMDAMAKTSGQCVSDDVWNKTVNKLKRIRNEYRAKALYWTLMTFNTERKETLPTYPARYGSAPTARTDYTATVLKLWWEQVGPSKWAPLGSVMKALDCLNAPEIPPKVAETYNALMAIYDAMNGHTWVRRKNDDYIPAWPPVWELVMNTENRWGRLSDTPSMADFDNWHGVTVEDGKITRLNISLSKSGSGRISPEIGKLTDLEFLQISRGLKGSIPAEIGNLTNLERMWLHDNQLTGSIPAEIGNMRNLIGLSFAGSQLTGTIPAEIGNLWRLRDLSLSGNQLTGSIPAEIRNIRNLASLRLDNTEVCTPAELADWLQTLYTFLPGAGPCDE